MSKSTIGWRRAGFSGLATALALGVSVAGGGVASAAVGDYSSAGEPTVTQGMTEQDAADLTYEFDGAYPTNSTITFTVADDDGNNCVNAADEAVEFSDVPTIAVTGPDDSNPPAASGTLGSSSAACATVGVQDQLTIRLNNNQPSSDTVDYVMKLSGIAYNVGENAAVGDVTATVSGLSAPAAPGNAVVNAVVADRSYTYVPLLSALPPSNGNPLGMAEFVEAREGAFFPTGETTVTMSLDDGATFTPGVTPTISVPPGYDVNAVGPAGAQGAPETDGSNTYSFDVVAPANETEARVTVSGLDANVLGSITTVYLTTDLAPAAEAAFTSSNPALNVVEFDERIGGQDRYGTAAALYSSEFNGRSEAVLSSGEEFPDALSANYLAGKLSTGTLLTRSNTLPEETENAIIDNGVWTVYITGGTLAVSQGVENDLESTRVGGNPNAPFIDVIRLGGQNRYDTNKRINEYQIDRSGNTVLMASGGGFADALTVGPIAYAEQFPLILSHGTSIGAQERSQLDNFNPDNVVIAGGELAISKGVEEALKDMGYNVQRYAGTNRTETAAALATWATVGLDGDGDGDMSEGIEGSRDFSTPELAISNGDEFPDSLAAGPVAGVNEYAILLAGGTNELGRGLDAYLGTKTVGTAFNGEELETLTAVGLTLAIGNDLMRDAAAEILPAPQGATE